MTRDETGRAGDDRPSPAEMLERARREPGTGARGRLRVFLGMAPGVGKTCAMLREGHRLRAAGVDVVVGLVETHGRAATEAAVGDLEVVPRRRVEYRGVMVEEMDAGAVLRRHPGVALVDELAHTNAPGSEHEKRWQDVESLLAAGITVVGTVNIQHLESLADIVESITGIRVGERLPDRIVDDADEIQLVDLSPAALRERLEAGHVYPPDRAERAKREFFREGNLTALRELALRKVSANVEEDLQAYMRRHDIDAVWPAGDAVLVGVDANAHAADLLRRGWRIADRLGAPLLAVFVETPPWGAAPPERRRALEKNLRLAEDLGARVVRVIGDDVAGALARVARDKNASHIVVGQSRHGWLYRLLRGSIVNRLLDLARNADVLVVADRDRRR